MLDFEPVAGRPNAYTVVNQHSGKCVDVSQVSTTPSAKIHRWTCDPASSLNNWRNQIWRLQGLG